MPSARINKKVTVFEAVRIIKEFIRGDLTRKNWFKKIKLHIKAILLYGSVAKGTNRPDSDIDILIITPLKIEEKYTKGEYVYQYKKYRINIVLRSIERLRRLARKPTRFQAEVFRKSRIIWEKDKELRKLTERIKQ
ncbi:MAG TPA: nucleotidyltransferase domain-containing protein [Candidatus Nanoarchaeia archaeon]|nr:nucleotidyltransferase domain-containing protein [Candidatus Nanoarchaeia archaeon]